MFLYCNIKGTDILIFVSLCFLQFIGIFFQAGNKKNWRMSFEQKKSI